MNKLNLFFLLVLFFIYGCKESSDEITGSNLKLPDLLSNIHPSKNCRK